jgi:hypothetical protein
MTKKKDDELHIPIPEPPHPGRTAHSDEERAPSVPPMRPNEGPAGTPGHHPHHEPTIIHPQPSSVPYPGVGVT